MWVRSEWRSTWRSLLGVALLIAFTAGSAMAAVAGAQRAEVALDRFLSDIRQSEVTIYTPGALDPAVSALIADDSRIDGTATVAVVAAGPEPLVPGAEAIVVSAPDSYWGGLHRPRLIDGRAPSGPAEVAMTEFSMEHNGLAIGDVIDLRLLRLDELLRCSASGDCDLAELAPVTITGVVRTVDDLAPSPFEHSLFFARSDWLDANGGPAIATGFTTELHLAPGASVEEVIGTYASRIDDGDVTSTRNFLDGPLLAGDLQHDVLLIAALAVGATGLVVCSLAMSRLLGRTSGDGETLTALGMQRAERTVAGSLVASLSAVLGSVLAVGVAASLSPLFPLGSMRRADPGVGFHAPTGAVAVGGLLTLIVTGGIGVGVSARWSRRAGPDRDQRPLSAAAQATERLRLPAVPSMGSRFALERGTATHRTPALAALTASVIGIAALVGALVVVQSLDGLLATGARYGATWDLQVALGDRVAETGETALGSTVVDEVADDPRIAGSAVASVGELDVASGDRRLSQVYTVGFETRSGGLAPVLLEGRGIQGPDEVLLGSNSMADLGVDLGDRVAVAGPSGQASMLVVGRGFDPDPRIGPGRRRRCGLPRGLRRAGCHRHRGRGRCHIVAAPRHRGCRGGSSRQRGAARRRRPRRRRVPPVERVGARRPALGPPPVRRIRRRARRPVRIALAADDRTTAPARPRRAAGDRRQGARRSRRRRVAVAGRGDGRARAGHPARADRRARRVAGDRRTNPGDRRRRDPMAGRRARARRRRRGRTGARRLAGMGRRSAPSCRGPQGRVMLAPPSSTRWHH